MSKVESEYVLTQPVDPATGLGIKQGHKCCSCCCDVRRATIIVNIIAAVLNAMSILAVLSAKGVVANAQDADDDEIQQAVADFEAIPVGPWFYVVQVLRVGLALAGIFGALKYKVPLIGAAAAMYIGDIILSLVNFEIAGVVLAGFFLYPHFFLIQEIRQGIMSQENYVNEQHSCCCV